MKTCVEIAGINYPESYKGNTILPMEGKSLIPAFSNLSIDREFIFWEHEGNRAIRVGNWKLVSMVQKTKKFTSADENAWELYDMETDRSEINNLASVNPDKVNELAALWEKEAIRLKVKPWPYGNSSNIDSQI